MRRGYRSTVDRVLASIEIVALGLWLGALCGFAFVFAPSAFHIVSDLHQFAALTARSLSLLSLTGYVAGGLVIAIALVRSTQAADRTNDIVRAGLVAIALGLVAYQQQTIVPAMAATTQFASPEYHALHARSTQLFGAVVLLGVAALVMVAARSNE